MPQWFTSEVLARKVWSDGLFTITVDGSERRTVSARDNSCSWAVFHRVMTATGTRSSIGRIPSHHRTAIEIEFFIVRVDGGALTPLLWDLDVGDALQVSRKGTGSFTLKKTPDAENLWLMATGTGLAPYIAMLRTAEPWERYTKESYWSMACGWQPISRIPKSCNRFRSSIW